MEYITIISGVQLSDRIRRKYHLSNPRQIKLRGYKYGTRSYPVASEKDNSVIEVHLYNANVTGRKSKKLMKGERYQVENNTVYWFEENYHGLRNSILIIMAELFLLTLVILAGYLYIRKEKADPTVGVETEEKVGDAIEE